nr:45 kDa calcium-binding protein isoform X1 [Globicephala melas]
MSRVFLIRPVSNRFVIGERLARVHLLSRTPPRAVPLGGATVGPVGPPAAAVASPAPCPGQIKHVASRPRLRSTSQVRFLFWSGFRFTERCRPRHTVETRTRRCSVTVPRAPGCRQGLWFMERRPQRVDLNTDRRISAKEMQRWIMEKTAEHFQEAITESKAHFRAVDPDGDGHVSWDEYKVKFLASKGHDEREVADKIKNKWDLNIDEETQEVLENLKDRWYQADNPPPDLLLTESEFLSFLHPEHSRGMLQFMVKEIIRDLDQDGDKKLSLSEFISLPVGTVENQQGQDVDDGWVRDRKREFEELIDANRDGIVTAAELEDYMDPMNEFSALNEAKQMIAVADENQNHCLEPEEVLKYSEFFTGSKLVDYARSVHEEF